VLLTAAGLFIRTRVTLRPHEFSVDPNRVLQFMITPQPELYNEQRMRTMIAELLRKVSEIPGVESAALASPGPFTPAGSERDVHVPGGNTARICDDDVTPGAFRTFGMKLIAGRDFTAADKPTAPFVVIINQSAARLLY